MIRAGLPLVVLVCQTVTDIRVAQRPDTMKDGVVIHAVGNLLGQIEGFCEDPGGPYDWSTGSNIPEVCADNAERKSRWLGGVLGVRDLLSSTQRKDTDLLIIAGNNETPRPGGRMFWNELAALKPTVVGLGREDFVRNVRASTGSVRAMYEAIRGAANLPLLASNVAIRETRDDLNTIEFEADGYDVHWDDDVSMAWTGSIKIGHPREVSLTAELREFVVRPTNGATGLKTDVTFKPGKGGADGTVTFSSGLRPNRWYRLVLAGDGAPKVSVVFKSDSALTPMNDEPLEGFPVRYLQQSLLMVAMVDPDAIDDAGESAWSWEDGGATWELVFTDPVKTLGMLKKRATKQHPDDKEVERAPAVVLISDLTDEQNIEVFDEFSDIRVVVLHPESAMLARASQAGERKTLTSANTPEPKPTRFSGDRGFAGVVDVQYPQVTRMLVRPEWFGETLITVKGTLVEKEFAWRIETPTTNVHVVPGRPLNTSVTAGIVTYSAGNVPIDRQQLYRDCPKDPAGPCRIFRDLWQKSSEIVSLLGDALRTATRADLAIIPSSIVDPDYQGYVKRRLDDDRTDWLSRYVLERLVYQSPRIVRAVVPGSALLATLKKALDDDESNCISGIGGGCPTTLATEHPERFRINGRNINSNLSYTIAMPDSLAERLDLEHNDDEDLVDVVEAGHNQLLAGRWVVSNGSGPLGEQLEGARNRNWEGYVAIPTFDLGLIEVKPLDPEGATGVRRSLGLPFSGAKRTTTRSITLDSDIALANMPRWALRVPASIDYLRRTQDGATSYEENAFETGVRLDWKVKWARPFVGYFFDGQLFEEEETLTASRPLDAPREGFSSSEAATFSTTFVVKPRRFRHYGGGVDLLHDINVPTDGGFSLGLKRVGVRVTRGTETNVPIGLRIGDEEADAEETFLNRFLSQGGQALLNRYFTEHPESFNAQTEFVIDPGSVTKIRIDVDGELALKYKVAKREYAGEVKARYRFHEEPGPATSPFILSADWRVEAKVMIPIVWKLQLTPAYEWQGATIERAADDVFYYQKFELRVSLPLMMRFGRTRLVR